MNESNPNPASGAGPDPSAHTWEDERTWFKNWMREGAEKAGQMFGPPSAATNHFREARLEFLRGIRAIIDHRIDNLSRQKARGARVVVD